MSRAEPVPVTSEDQLKVNVGKRVRLVGTVTYEKGWPQVNSAAGSVYAKDWPRQQAFSEIAGKRIEVLADLAWQEPYTVPPSTEPDDGLRQTNLYPGKHVQGYFYLTNVSYRLLE